MAAVVLGTPFFDVMICLFAAVAALELYEILRPHGPLGRGYTVVLVAVALVFCAYHASHIYLALICVVCLALTFAALQAIRNDRIRWKQNVIYPLCGAMYVGLPLATLILIRNLPDGLLWLIALTFTVWATDTMALFGGRLFGKRKLAPQISPSKTVEGALTGILFGIGFGTSIMVAGGTSLAVALVLGVAGSVMAVLGDLLESLLKRVFRVKDASGLLPGHGGMLDRLDSFIAVAPVFYILVLLLSTG